MINSAKMKFLGTFCGMLILAGCVPSEIEAQCKREAIQSGFGKCSIGKGRQNNAGVWLLKMDCSRGVASCLNNTTGSVSVEEWTDTSDYLYDMQ